MLFRIFIVIIVCSMKEKDLLVVFFVYCFGVFRRWVRLLRRICLNSLILGVFMKGVRLWGRYSFYVGWEFFEEVVREFCFVVCGGGFGRRVFVFFGIFYMWCWDLFVGVELFFFGLLGFFYKECLWGEVI